MSAGLFQVRWLLADTQLGELLRDTAYAADAAFECGRLSEITAEAVFGVHLLVCDATQVGIPLVRKAAPHAYIIAVLPQEASESAADEIYAAAEEVWFAPVRLPHARHRFAAALRLLQERRAARMTAIHLEAVIDNSPDLIWFKDVRGAHLKVNEAFCTAVGKTKQQIEGRGHYYIWDIAPDEYATSEFVCLETEEIVLNRRTRCLFDEKVQCKQGMRHFKTYKSPLIDDQGTLLGTVGVAQDVTRHMQTTTQLTERMASMATAISTAQIYHWRFNPATRTAWPGDTLAATMNLPRVLENYPQSLLDRGLIHPDSIDICLERHRALSLENPGSAYDLHMRLPDGTECWKRVHYRRVESESGESELLGIAEEITEAKRLEQSVTAAARQNGMAIWLYDVESGSIRAIVDPLGIIDLRKAAEACTSDEQAVTQHLHKDDLAQVQALHEKIERGEQAVSAVVRWRIPGTADWSWFRLSYTTVFNIGGTPVQAIGSALNLSSLRLSQPVTQE